jgi:predicted dehydrogenase
MLGVGIIGFGYWGPNIVRNFMEIREAAVRRVVDVREDRLELLDRRYPAVQVGRDAGELISDPKIDAVVIATPTASHFELAMQAFGAGKHVLIEKPMTATVAEADRLVAEARTSWAHSDGGSYLCLHASSALHPRIDNARRLGSDILL